MKFINIPSLFKYELLIQLLKIAAIFFVFLLYFNKKWSQFLNYCRHYLIKYSLLCEIGVILY